MAVGDRRRDLGELTLALLSVEPVLAAAVRAREHRVDTATASVDYRFRSSILVLR